MNRIPYGWICKAYLILTFPDPYLPGDPNVKVLNCVLLSFGIVQSLGEDCLLNVEDKSQWQYCSICCFKFPCESQILLCISIHIFSLWECQAPYWEWWIAQQWTVQDNCHENIWYLLETCWLYHKETLINITEKVILMGREKLIIQWE